MLVTVDDLRSKYGFTFSEKADAEYEALLATAEEECLSYAGLEIGNIDEYIEGNGGKIYCLSHKPIVEITSVSIDEKPISFRYEARASKIVLSSSAPVGSEIVISMKLGWAEGNEPASLKTAIALTAQHLSKLQSSKQMGVLSRTTEGGTEQIEQSIPPLAVKGLLDRFKLAVL